MTTEREEQFYQLALTRIENIGPRLARNLLDKFGTAKAVFKASGKELSAVENFGTYRIHSMKNKVNFSFPEQELRFMEQQGIRSIFINDPEYPKKLKHCTDAPILLYYKGNSKLHNLKTVSIVGTRNNTRYGQIVTEQLVAGLKDVKDLLIVSGLASGIDGIAHRQAIQSGIPTLGVLAHGLDRIYPAVHRQMAGEMTVAGGLLTEFPSGTSPEKQNFPLRNRIVAGIADVTVVIETGERGGSMITAKLASSYNRDVAAFPGRVSDSKSQGCNYLIKTNIAQIITGTGDLLEMMNWEQEIRPRTARQPKLFESLNTDEQSVIDLIKKQEVAHIDEISLKSGLPGGRLASILLNLEMEGYLDNLPGKRYKICETYNLNQKL